MGDTTETLDFGLDTPIDIDNWKEGVEVLAKCSEEQLWQLLGLPEQHLPFFQEWTDPSAQTSPRSEEGRK